MQAPPSHIASGEHLFSGLASPLSIPPTHAPFRDMAEVPVELRTVWRAGAVADHAPSYGPVPEVADGIGLAHDAGNLLGAIRLYCDLLALPGVLRSEHRHYAEELRHLTARSGSLIDRLLRPAELASGMEGVVRIRLAEAVVACRGMLDGIAGSGSLLIAVEERAKGEVALPHEALERILVNLTKNAAEACREEPGGSNAHGTITVRVRSVEGWKPGQGDGLALSVEDCGRGMDDATLCAALSGTSSVAGERPGRGIGLRVVRELAARTGGELRMRSRAGHGTTVEIVWAAFQPLDRAESG